MKHPDPDSYDVEVEDIEWPDRLRQDFGDITGLAKSIRTYGLIHAIHIEWSEDGLRRGVAGHRRWMAHKAARAAFLKQVDTA